MTEQRIKLTDTTIDALFKMSEGNPGAATVCVNLLKSGGEIDPDDAFQGFGKIMSLDTLGIYGSKIWMLYKDVCNQNLNSMVAVLRARQLGIISEAQIYTAIENYGEGLNISELVQKVCEQLPKFQKQATAHTP